MATDSTAIEVIGDISEHSLIWIIIVMILANGITFNKKFTSFPTWYFVTWLSFTRMLGLVNSDLDLLALFFFRKVTKGLHGVQAITYSDGNSSNGRFAELNYKSYHFINNTEKFLIVFFGCLAIYITLKILSFCHDGIKTFKEEVCENMMIRAIIVCSFDFYLFGVLQIYHMNLDSAYTSICSVCAAVLIVIFIISTVCFPIYITGQRSSSTLTIHNSTLLYEFDYKEGLKGYYYFVFLVSRLISAIFLAAVQDFPIAQVIGIGFCCSIQIAFILKYRPYRENFVNYLVLACEICQLLILICLASYIAELPDLAQFYLRWIIICCFWIGCLICIARYLYDMIRKSIVSQVNVTDNPSGIEAKENRRKESNAELMAENKQKRSSFFGYTPQYSGNENSFTPSGSFLPASIAKNSGNKGGSSLATPISSKHERSNLGSRNSVIQSTLKNKSEKKNLPVVEDLDENEIEKDEIIDNSYGELVQNNEKTEFSGVNYYTSLSRKFKERYINK